MPSKTIVPENKGQIIQADEALRLQIEAQQRLLSQVAKGSSSQFISFKGGQIIIDGRPVPGNKSDMIVLAFMGERTYYEGRFDPDSRQSPDCYAYFQDGEDSEDMKPHKAAQNPQCERCEDCEWNKWNTAEVGRGKKCRESIRLAVLPASGDLAKQTTWHARIPITSVPAFKSVAADILGYNRPLHHAVLTCTVTPDPKTFFKINWAIKEPVDKKYIAAVNAKAVIAQTQLAFEYPVFDEEQVAPAKPLKGKAAKGKGAK